MSLNFRLKDPNTLLPLFYLAIACLLAIRFLGLDSDFPLGITQSGTLYTDEGWYANAAVRQYFFGEWYFVGDFNPIVNIPIAQFLYFASFELFGPGLKSGRAVTALFSLLLIFLFSLFMGKKFGKTAALIGLALFSVNFVFFAYSRLMLLEVMATALTFLAFFILSSAQRVDLVKVALAALLLGLGVLTKTTMIFMIPILLLMLLRAKEELGARLVKASLFLGVLSAVVAGFYYWAQSSYPIDFAYFKELNYSNRSFSGPLEWLLNVPLVLVRVGTFGYELILVTALTTLYAFIKSKAYRENPYVLYFALYAVFYLGLLTLVSYTPPRYYLPLLVPILFFSASSVAVILKEGKVRKEIIVAVLAMMTLFQGQKIAHHLLNPAYSFRDMANSVAQLIREREGQQDISDVYVVGSIVDTVAIQTGIRAMNSSLAIEEFDTRLSQLKPDYFLLHTGVKEQETFIKHGAELELMAEWDVFDNYYAAGERIKLYQVHWQ